MGRDESRAEVLGGGEEKQRRKGMGGVRLRRRTDETEDAGRGGITGLARKISQGRSCDVHLLTLS